VNGLQQEKIWDPVLRLWHWVLVLAVCVSWSFGEFMSFDNVVWHFYLGYLIFGLLGFRILWGVIGPKPARFRSFLPTSRSVIEYMKTLSRRSPSGIAGHNAMGALWIFAMLFLLLAQAFTGLFIDADDFFEYGPLYDSVSEDTAKLFNGWHSTMSDIILIMVILHVSVVLFYLIWKKENLIKPMITGWKWVKEKDQDKP
jgi:cytochrome b